jgi:peptidoglycan-associated lipoprotein
MKPISVLIAAGLSAAACSHAQPQPAVQVVEPVVQQATPAVQIPPPQPPPAPRTVEITPASIYFAFDSAELTSEARAALQRLFDQARQRPDQDLRIEGNCDERGTEEYNVALGQRRADAAKKYLVDLGMDAARVTTVSNGKERPRALGHDEEAWRENRRDDLMVKITAVSQADR